MAPSICDSLGLADSGVISLIGAGGKTTLMFGLARELAAGGHTVLTTTTTSLYFPSTTQSRITLIVPSPEELVTQAIPLLPEYPHLSAGSRRIPGQGKLKGFSADTIDKVWQSGCFDWIIVEADGARQKPIKASAAHEPVVPGLTTCIIHVSGMDALGVPLDDAHVHRSAIFSQNTGLSPGAPVDLSVMATSAAHELRKAAAMARSVVTRSVVTRSVVTRSVVTRSVVTGSVVTVAWFNKADDPKRVAAGYAAGRLLLFLWQKEPPRQERHSGRIVIASLADPVSIKGVLVA